LTLVIVLIAAPAGSKGRVHARVDFTRGGSRTLRHTTVSRAFVIRG
jgi:hypothetical protein